MNKEYNELSNEVKSFLLSCPPILQMVKDGKNPVFSSYAIESIEDVLTQLYGTIDAMENHYLMSLELSAAEWLGQAIMMGQLPRMGNRDTLELYDDFRQEYRWYLFPTDGIIYLEKMEEYEEIVGDGGLFTDDLDKLHRKFRT